MRILCFGSLNLDNVYQVDHIVQPGETTISTSYQRFDGGKGLNQALALGRANADCCMAGMIGQDGLHLKETLEESNVKANFVGVSETCNTGSTIIQVDKNGQNSIIVVGGSNQIIDEEYIKNVISNFEPGDFILLQNEINNIPFIMKEAKQKGLKIAFNPSPITDELLEYPLDLVDILVLNEIEGHELTKEKNYVNILNKLHKLYPNTLVLLTLGKKGALFSDGVNSYSHGIYDVKVVDTTAAGDTFTGYFLASYANNLPIEECLRKASIASSLAVSRPGASTSIPYLSEVESSNLTLIKVE
jgi:ribokinase